MVDGSEFSENSNASSSLHDELSNPLDTSDIHQKGKFMIFPLYNIQIFSFDVFVVLTLLRTNENSWPFLEPVTEELAPNYFTLIEVNIK